MRLVVFSVGVAVADGDVDFGVDVVIVELKVAYVADVVAAFMVFVVVLWFVRSCFVVRPFLWWSVLRR